MKNTYVLVHGAWQAGWIWEDVKKYLEAEGNKVISVDLPGHGEDNRPMEDQNLDTYSDALVNILNEQEQPVILLGHSMGGMSISQAACIVPEKISKLVYLCAFLPKDGQSNDGIDGNGIKPTDWKTMAEEGVGVTIHRDGKTSTLSDEMIIHACLNDVTDEDVKNILPRFGEQPLAPQCQPVKITDVFYSIPKVYIRCLQDNILSLELQDKMIADTPVEQVFTMDASHSPFFSRPEELAKILLSL